MLFSPLFSGSSGNATFIETGNTRVLVDAGLPGSRIEEALNAINIPPETISALLVTHEHSDHVKGAGVLSRRYNIPIYANAPCFEAMLPIIGEIRPGNMRVFEANRDFFIGDTNILPFTIPHDAASPVGFVFAYKCRRVGVLTDIGHMDAHLYDAVDKCHLLLLEANHDIEMLKTGSYPYPLKQRILSRKGHLSNDDSAKALCKLYKRGLKHAILGHLSAENNDERVAMDTVVSALKNEGIKDMQIAMSHRDKPCGVFHL